MRKVLQGLIVTSVVAIVPLAGNLGMLRAPHLWILIVIGVLGSLFQPRYSPFQRPPDTRDRGTANQIIWSIYLTQFMVIIEATYIRYPASSTWNTLTTVALILMATGLAIRTWAVFTLGRYFTWHISVQKEQTVTRTGPYSFIRHPGYFGAFLTYASTALFLKAWVSLVLSPVILSFAFARRIRHEEAELRRELGRPYEIYCDSVKRLIPGIW